MIFPQVTKEKNEPVGLAHEGTGEAAHRGGSLTGPGNANDNQDVLFTTVRPAKTKASVSTRVG